MEDTSSVDCANVDLKQEKIIVENINDEPEQVSTWIWSVNATRQLLALLKKYKPLLGSFKVKSNKHMYQIISQELSSSLKKTIAPNHCENRWRVLERNYKKYLMNQQNKLRIGRFFEFSEEMKAILGDKPQVGVDEAEALESDEPTNTTITTPEYLADRKRTFERRKRSTLEMIRRDRKDYYERRLRIEEAKLVEMKRRNDMLKESNNILQRSLQFEVHIKNRLVKE